MSTAETDFLIVGQGLAGSLLAFCLLEKNQRVLVLDNSHERSSTQVAAGTINPITGHRLNITERFHSYFPVAQAMYTRLEEVVNTKIFHPTEQIRLIKNSGQAEYLEQRLVQKDYRAMLKKTDTQDYKSAAFGCVSVGSTAVVDTKTMLATMRDWLTHKGAYRREQFEYRECGLKQGCVQYKGIQARKIIFCEGYQAINNPWLNHLPFKLAKGEILTIEQSSKPDKMLSWGNWLVPATKLSAKLGSNFEWDSLDLTPTPKVAKKLIDSLTTHTNKIGTVVDHEVGIRPTTKQRKPFVGPLSNQANAFCFNGLGSKGCLIAPYFAERLCAHLLDQEPLPEEVTIWL